MTKYYVYILVDPTNNLPFYVGKGCGDRWLSHYKETLTTTTNKRKFYKIRQLKELGYEPRVTFWARNLDEDTAYALEKTLIERFGRKTYDKNGMLLNICIDANPPGWNHCSDQEALRKKFQKNATENNPFKGKSHTQEAKKKIGAAYKGKTISDTQKLQISKAHKGKKKPPEFGAKISAALKGKPKSEAHKKKIGDFHKGKIISTEQRAKISASSKGRKISEETREKLRQAALKREARKRGEL